MKNYFLITLGLLGLFVSHSFAVKAESRVHPAFLIYQASQKEIANCADVECYKNVLKKYGSSSTINNLEKATPEMLENTFKTAKNTAIDRTTKNKEYVLETKFNDNTAEIILGVENFPEMKSTAYFTRENGEWKIGKAKQ
jgi:CTP:phosphocholine cytidylyltransferase-like protein